MFREIKPKQSSTDKVVKENSTHIAIKAGGVISIWEKGFEFYEEEDGSNMKYEPEHLRDIFASDADDLFSIFGAIEEELRILRAEANDEFRLYRK